ncbi:MAG: hypothetical protein OXE93_08380 [bacterium]|nr:hypothetical protein [bacterium]
MTVSPPGEYHKRSFKHEVSQVPNLQTATSLATPKYLTGLRLFVTDLDDTQSALKRCGTLLDTQLTGNTNHRSPDFFHDPNSHIAQTPDQSFFYV